MSKIYSYCSHSSLWAVYILPLKYIAPLVFLLLELPIMFHRLTLVHQLPKPPLPLLTIYSPEKIKLNMMIFLTCLSNMNNQLQFFIPLPTVIILKIAGTCIKVVSIRFNCPEIQTYCQLSQLHMQGTHLALKCTYHLDPSLFTKVAPTPIQSIRHNVCVSVPSWDFLGSCSCIQWWSSDR